MQRRRRAGHGGTELGRYEDQGSPTGRDQGGRAMNDFLNQLVFGWYPYLAVTVLVVGSILRFDAPRFTCPAHRANSLRGSIRFPAPPCFQWVCLSCWSVPSSAC